MFKAVPQVQPLNAEIQEPVRGLCCTSGEDVPAGSNRAVPVYCRLISVIILFFQPQKNSFTCYCKAVELFQPHSRRDDRAVRAGNAGMLSGGQILKSVSASQRSVEDFVEVSLWVGLASSPQS